MVVHDGRRTLQLRRFPTERVILGIGRVGVVQRFGASGLLLERLVESELGHDHVGLVGQR